jgi:hypothetical protein
MPQETKSVTYKCSNASCGETMTLRFFVDDKPHPVTCCVKCRAGFGIELSTQMQNHIGMFPIGRAA